MISASTPPFFAPSLVAREDGGIKAVSASATLEKSNETANRKPETASKAAKPGSTEPQAGAEPRKAVQAKAAAENLSLDEAELRQLDELKARDREVRAHEAAHQAAGGQYAGAVSFTFQRGPDGVQYAVGGEVSISLTPIEGNPDATIEKMRTVRAAALAPAEPSAQDRAVAAEATQIMLQAKTEKATAEEDPQNANTEEAGAEPRVVNRADDASQAYRSVAGLSDSNRPEFQATA